MSVFKVGGSLIVIFVLFVWNDTGEMQHNKLWTWWEVKVLCIQLWKNLLPLNRRRWIAVL